MLYAIICILWVLGFCSSMAIIEDEWDHLTAVKRVKSATFIFATWPFLALYGLIAYAIGKFAP